MSGADNTSARILGILQDPAHVECEAFLHSERTQPGLLPHDCWIDSKRDWIEANGKRVYQFNSLKTLRLGPVCQHVHMEKVKVGFEKENGGDETRTCARLRVCPLPWGVTTRTSEPYLSETLRLSANRMAT